MVLKRTEQNTVGTFDEDLVEIDDLTERELEEIHELIG